MYLYSCSGANSNKWCRLDGSCSDALAGSEPVMNDDDGKETGRVAKWTSKGLM